MADIKDRLKDVRKIQILPYDGEVRLLVEMQARTDDAIPIHELQLFVKPENMEAVVETFLLAMTLKL